METKKHVSFLIAAACLMPLISFAKLPEPAAVPSHSQALTDSVFLKELMEAYDLVHEKNIKIGCTNLPPTVKLTVRSPDLIIGSAVGGRTCYGNILGIDRVQRVWRLTNEGSKVDVIENLLVTKSGGHALVLSDFPNYAERLKKALHSSCKRGSPGNWPFEEAKAERPAIYFEKKGITVMPSTKADHPCWPGVFYSYKEVGQFLSPTLKSAVQP